MAAEAEHTGASVSHRGTRRGWRLLPLAAFLLTAATVLAVRALAGQAPWDRAPVLVGDFANQTVPMLAYYRDVLTGQANGDLLFSWGMSYGQSFWGTWAQYLSNPWNLVVLAFPRSAVAGAAITAHVLTAASAGAAMAAALRRMHRGDPLLALALSLAWGASPFVLMDSHYHPYWTVGSVALPLVVLTACWVRDGRHAWAVPPVVGALMVANFYTGYMGVLGGGLVVLAWMVASPEEWSRPVRTLVRWVLLGGCGVVMAAFVLVPTYAAVQRSAMTADVPFAHGSAADWFAAALPGADTVGRAPSWTLGVVVLVLLVAHLVADRGRRALVWTLTIVALLVSFGLRPTAMLWHGGDVPDGNFFREAWVAAGAGALALWHLAARRDGRRAAGEQPRSLVPGALVGLLLVALAAVAALGSPVATPTAATLGVVLGALAVAALVVRAHHGAPGGAALVVLVLLTTLVGGPVALDRFRSRIGGQAISYAFYPSLADAAQANLAAGHGPDAGAYVPMRHTPNDPLLLGGVGATGYTTMMPERVASLLSGLGATAGAAGRRLWSRGSALELATFGVREPGADDRTQARWVDPEAARADAGGSRWQQIIAGGLLDGVVPATRATDGGWTTYLCPASATRMTVDVEGARGRLQTARGTTPLPPPDPARGSVWTEDLAPGQTLRHDVAGGRQLSVWCHGDVVGQSGEPADLHRSGHGLTVARQPGTGRDLVIGTTWSDEWSCSTDGADADTYPRAGLLALRNPMGPVSCTFRPAGGVAGASVSGAALALWALGCGVGLLRQRGCRSRPVGP